MYTGTQPMWAFLMWWCKAEVCLFQFVLSVLSVLFTVFIFYTDNLDRINALKIAVGHVYVPMLYKLELSIFRFAECYGNIAGLREQLHQLWGPYVKTHTESVFFRFLSVLFLSKQMPHNSQNVYYPANFTTLYILNHIAIQHNVNI